MKLPVFEIQNLTKNCNEVLILVILSDGIKHGYQVALEIEERSQGYFKFNHGTLYPILHKLESEGLIKGVWKQEGPKRKRKNYSLTDKGKTYMNSQVAEWQNFINSLLNILGDVNQ
jgi:PadR family transcriptional regulator PadR